MVDKLLYALEKGIFQNASSPISNNTFAKKVLNLYRNGGIDALSVDKLLVINISNPHEVKPINIDSDDIFRDKRIVRASMHGIRGIPYIKDNEYYGINLMADEVPVSAIIMGSNGTGKTSLYCGLEIAGMNNSNCARLRGYVNRDEQLNFLTTVGQGIDKLRAVLNFTDDSISDYIVDSDNNAYNTPFDEACFCSDFDIHYLEKCSYQSSENSYDGFIHLQLGLQQFKTTIDNLKAFRIKFAAKSKEVTENFNEARNNLLNTEASDIIIKLIDKKKSAPYIDRLKEVFCTSIHSDLDSFMESILIDKKANRFNYRNIIYQISTELSLLCNIYNENGTRSIRLYKHLNPFSQQTIIDTIKENIRLFPCIYRYAIYTVKRVQNSSGAGAGNIIKDNRYVFDLLRLYRLRIKELISEYINKKDDGQELTSFKDRLISLNVHSTLYLKEKGYIELPIPNDIATETIEGANSLIDYLNKTLLDYHYKIYKILAQVIPAIMNGTFIKGDDKIEISYGQTKCFNGESNVPLFTSISTFELAIIKDIGKDRDGNPTFERVEPRKYLNTFRHKLFSFALKLALACCSMKLNNCVMPIIVDDMFDASDFSNRSAVSKVMENLIKAFNEVMKADVGKDCFQIIFFTQDELIGEKLYQGITRSNLNKDGKPNGNNKVKLCRLLGIQDYHNGRKYGLNKEFKSLRFPLFDILSEISMFDITKNIKSNYNEKKS